MPMSLLDLPREVLRQIALNTYDPLELTQQDRLTWGIFSTVDMHQERQDDLASLISLGNTCRKIRREVRRTLFNCIRIPSVNHAHEVIANRDGWARYVKSIIIDLSMFDQDDGPLRPRTCWAESALLHNLLISLPSLQHLSFFADASDDSTLALLFAALIPHPSLHSIPPTVPTSPSLVSAASGYIPYTPLSHRLKSFGWRQRAAPPPAFRTFSQSTIFVSTLHLLRHAHNLSFLVLDADMDEMTKLDILTAAKELSLRQPPVGEEVAKVSLMLCGPIKEWEDGFLDELVGTFVDIKELFIDRPLRKSKRSHATDFDAFTTLLRPLERLPHLHLLQVGSYTFTSSVQTSIALHLAHSIPSLVVLGLLGEQGETVWSGIWRRASTRGLLQSAPPYGTYDRLADVLLLPLADGHLRQLEDEQVKSLPSTPPPEDVRMTPVTPEVGRGLQLDTEGKSVMSLRRILSSG